MIRRVEVLVRLGKALEDATIENYLNEMSDPFVKRVIYEKVVIADRIVSILLKTLNKDELYFLEEWGVITKETSSLPK